MMEIADTSQRQLVPKKRRGRPPKIRVLLPTDSECPTTSLPGETVSEMRMVYEPLKDMLEMTKLRPLVEAPNELLYGFHDYYDIIEKPLWLREMLRKYAENQYETVIDVMKDLRLVLENVYRFWGKEHKFAKQALRAERVVDKHLMKFPPELRSKCCLALYDSEDAVSPGVNDTIATDLENSENPKLLTFLTLCLPSLHSSKILRNLDLTSTTAKSSATPSEMEKWAEEVLKETQLKKEIHVMGELAEIGQFLSMAKDILCLKQISQYEIERMLVMARESTTLATIMTSFLCPPGIRHALYFKPIMVYDVWSTRLQKKMDNWYAVYHKFGCSRLAVFSKYGVEPPFFECVGEVNPLTNTPFHELALDKKAAILKALCCYMFHSNKKIEEYINAVGDDAVRPQILFSDSKQEYVSLFSPEIRVYRCSKIGFDIDATIETVFPQYFDFHPKVEIQDKFPEIPFSKKQKFHLIAHDPESLSNLSKMFAKMKRGRASINRLISEERNSELSLMGLRSLYNQWNKAVYKNPISLALSQQYWIIKTHNSITSGEEKLAKPSAEGGEAEVLGKRVTKRKFPLEDGEEVLSGGDGDDAKPNEDEASDWEDGHIRRSRRSKKASARPRFFDEEYMKFGNGDDDNDCHPKTALEGKVKKPRKKREKKVFGGDTSKEGKVVRRRGPKKSKNLEYSLKTPTVIMPDEPYLPPTGLSKFVQSSLPSINDGQSTSFELDNDLFDWGNWDFGVQPPLKPVEGPLPVVEEGEKKILELGAVKSVPTAPSMMIPSVPRLTPSLGPVKTPMTPIQPSLTPMTPILAPFGANQIPGLLKIKPVAPPRKHHAKPVFPAIPVSTNNFHSAQPTLLPIGRGRGRILPVPVPGPSVHPSRVFLPWQDVGNPRLVPLNPKFLPGDTIVVKTGPPQFRLPFQRVLAPLPLPGGQLKKKVNLPARPLSIPVVKGQDLPVFQSQALNGLDSSTVLYIPSGTPTISIPSVSRTNEGNSVL